MILVFLVGRYKVILVFLGGKIQSNLSVLRWEDTNVHSGTRIPIRSNGYLTVPCIKLSSTTKGSKVSSRTDTICPSCLQRIFQP